MSRTLRIVLFGGVALAAWCLTSDQLLSRVASTDESYDDAAPAAGAEQNESDYQVVKLLSKLFTSIKRNHVEVLNLHRQYSRSGEPVERNDLRHQMQDRIAFVEGKAHEYAQLVPSLQQSYPGLKSVIQSFSRDLKGISGDLELIKQTDGLLKSDDERTASADRPERSERSERSDRSDRSDHSDRAPRQMRSDRPQPGDIELTHEATQGRGGMLSDALNHERAEEALANGNSPNPAQPTERRERRELSPLGGGVEMTPNGPVVPITLEVRGGEGQNVDKRKIVFQVADNKKTGMRGFVDQGGLSKEAIAYTDSTGRAMVRLALDQTERPIRIKRTIFPRDDQTVCLLETMDAP